MLLNRTSKLLALVASGLVLVAGPPTSPKPANPNPIHLTILNTSHSTWTLAYTRNVPDMDQPVGKLSVESGGVKTAIANDGDQVKLAAGAEADLTLTRNGGRIYQALTLMDHTRAWVTLLCAAEQATDAISFTWGHVHPPNPQTTAEVLNRIFQEKDGKVTITEDQLP